MTDLLILSGLAMASAFLGFRFGLRLGRMQSLRQAVEPTP